MLFAEVADFLLAAFAVETPDSSQTPVRKSHALGLAQHIAGERFHRVFLPLKLHVINFFELVKEPGVDRRHLCYLLDGVPLAKSIADITQPLGMRRYQALRENLWLDFFGAQFLAGVECADAFEKRLFESAADSHYFADRLHLRPKRFVRTGKFFELPLRNFYDDIVERRFETGWSLARDVVWNLIERIADGQFCGNFRNGKSGRF